MAYQPTFPSPYLETIDVERAEGNIFKCLVNPKDVIVGARINIFSRDGILSPLTLDGSEVTLEVSRGYSAYINIEQDHNNLYEILNPLIKLGYTLAVEGENGGLRKIIEIENNSSYMRIYFEDRVASDFIRGNTYNVFSNFPVGVVDISDISQENPVYGGLGDDSWVSTTVAQSENITNGNDYDWNVELTSNDDSTIVSPKYFFKARTTPVIEFSNLPEIDISTNKRIINNCMYTFDATYEQAQNVKITYYRFDIYKNGVLVDSSGNQFSPKIQYTFDSFIDNSEYAVRLTVLNDDGVEVSTEEDISVEYSLLKSHISPTVEVDNFNTCIRVDYSNVSSIPSVFADEEGFTYESFGALTPHTITTGTVVSYEVLEGEPSVPRIGIIPYANIISGMYINIGNESHKISSYSYAEGDIVAFITADDVFATTISPGDTYEIISDYNGIHVDKSNSIMWNTASVKPLDLTDGGTQVIHWHGDKGFNGIILEKIDSSAPVSNVKVSFDGTRFIYNIGSNDAVEYNIYSTTETRSAIAGTTESGSELGTVQSYEASSKKIGLSNVYSADNFNKWIQIGNECRHIDGGDGTVYTLNSAFTEDASGKQYVLYSEDYKYVLADEDTLQDGDILIDNDLMNKYWWLIVILPEEVKVFKSKIYEESGV